MEHVVLRFLLASAVILTAATVISGERVNETSATTELVWSKGKLESDLLNKPEPGNSDYLSAGADVDDHDDLDGGFSSLDGVLRWAIGHSDPAKLKESAEDVQRLSASELQKRQLEIKELIEKMNMPSDAQLMQIAIDDLNNSSSSLEDRQRALQELLILVEPLDNANDLNKLGGLAIVIQELNHPDPDIRRLSAWVLGKACQNNPVVQKQILELGALTKLIKMVKSTSIEEAIKALYAVSALIRNNLSSQELFYAEAGDTMLQALVAIKNLLQLKTTGALIFKDFCDLNGSLVRMRQQLLDLMASEDHRDYAVDLENLRREVELIFHEKLGKGDGVCLCKSSPLSTSFPQLKSLKIPSQPLHPEENTKARNPMGNSRLTVISTFVPIMRGQLILYGCHWLILLFVMGVKGLAFFSFTRVKSTGQAWLEHAVVSVLFLYFGPLLVMAGPGSSGNGSGGSGPAGAGGGDGGVKKKGVPNSNYVVPLDNSLASAYTSCITRPISEILRDLNKRIPDNIIKPPNSSSTLIPWFHANRMLSFYAPGWCGEIRDVIFAENGSVTVVYRVTIRGSDGEAHRESSGTVSSSDVDIEDPVAAAEEIAFCRACARFGLGLYLYHEEQML
ncbi:hypothetical protein NC652_009365 [Populus alba x Populus x berolinensis]|nr:hypothetical protein NC652_009365 [Populus alba x Populus x berolinensis]